MKSFYTFFILTVFFSVQVFAQDTGSIVGKVTDKEYNDEPLPGVNIFIEGSTIGTNSDFDGLYGIDGLAPGPFNLVFSYIGKETQVIPINIEAGRVTEVNISMSDSEGFALQEVVVTTTRKADSEVALLLEEKGALTIVSKIGRQQLQELAVSNARDATRKISGVASSQNSGDIFIRGLGDRYLSTTLNGLPIPSDDVNKKNIDLALFPTRLVSNVGITKTFDVHKTADMSSGLVDIKSRELDKESELSVSVSVGSNSNVLQSGIFDNFRVSPNYDDVSLGHYTSDNPVFWDQDTRSGQIVDQAWDPVTLDNPIDFNVSLTAGKRFLDNKLSVLFTGSFGRSHDYSVEYFKQFQTNAAEDSLLNLERYNVNLSTTGLLDIVYRINDKNKIKSTTLYLNTVNEEMAEAGREGQSFIFEQDIFRRLPQFLRDQNLKQTNLITTQLLGEHELADWNTFTWSASYNILNADEPNRIRNLANVSPDLTFVDYGIRNPFDHRKSAQLIEDTEINIIGADKFQVIDEEATKFHIEFGGFYRDKLRDFESEFVGIQPIALDAINPPSVDELGAPITVDNIDDGIAGNGAEPLEITLLPNNRFDENKDIYTGTYESKGGFMDVNVTLDKWNFNAGLRFQRDLIFVDYDINQAPGGRRGQSRQVYNDLYPNLNIKYSISDKQLVRFGASRTITLPEFLEIAPFQYVNPTNQLIRGNPNLVASTDYNYEVKWELYPTSAQLISVAGFYKSIENPINRSRARSASFEFSYFNTAEEATVYGIELETRLSLIKPGFNEETGDPFGSKLGLVFNATRMWHNQVLMDEIDPVSGRRSETFRFGTNTETGLQGAADWIFNSSLNFSTVGENPFSAALTANYTSDKIFSVGDAANVDRFDLNYNDNIVEIGFVSLDARLSKEFGDFQVTLTGQNLLNPYIKQTQDILRNFAELSRISDLEERLAAPRDIENVLVNSYRIGIGASLGVSYRFQ